MSRVINDVHLVLSNLVVMTLYLKLLRRTGIQLPGRAASPFTFPNSRDHTVARKHTNSPRPLVIVFANELLESVQVCTV